MVNMVLHVCDEQQCSSYLTDHIPCMRDVAARVAEDVL